MPSLAFPPPPPDNPLHFLLTFFHQKVGLGGDWLEEGLAGAGRHRQAFFQHV